MQKKLGLLFAVVLVLALTACTRNATTPPADAAAQPTDSQGLIEPMTTDDPMAILQQYATQTAMAASGNPVAETPAAGTTPGVEITPLGGATADPNTLVTPTPEPVQPAAVVPTPTPGTPGSYTLQAGEFPYCIARRFNINPDDLLSLNGLSSGQIYDPNLTLKIPQSSKGFPGTRALISHPATHTVVAGDTIYTIACKYGDADPNQIIAANGLTAPYTLTPGKSIQIP